MSQPDQKHHAPHLEPDSRVAPEDSPEVPWRKRLISVSVLPTLCTVANGLSGLAAIHFATLNAVGHAEPWHLAAAGWLIFLAMVFDMLDGRLARMTRSTSDFGAQLDSLCDAVSFCAAPAVLMLRTCQMALRGVNVQRIDFLPDMFASFTLPDRILWAIGGLYMACGVLRLARFNVETDEAEESHMTFKGLPSPGAAAAVVSLVLVIDQLSRSQGLLSHPATMISVVVTLPLVTLIAALLMVSNVEYPHIANQIHLSRKPFGTIVKLVIIAMFAVLNFILTGATLAVIYVLSGPVRVLWRRAKRREKPA
ncbi:MAG: CDP-alcohol phosphatidyltransferase family protein [Phycisphaerae bacterium]